MRLVALAATLQVTGCANNAARDTGTAWDPFEPVNRVTFKINDLGDKFILRPLAKGYDTVTPAPVRTGINNFFDNLTYPVTITNDLLQGKLTQGVADAARFVANSVFGIGGIFDVAQYAGLERHDEDFGQTFGVWGIPEGPYLVVPLFGPRTMRHGIGNLADSLVHPQTQYDNSSVRTKVNLFYFVQQRSTLLAFDEELDRAFDKYSFVKDSYLQNRRFRRYDGDPPEEDLFFDEEDSAEFEDF